MKTRFTTAQARRDWAKVLRSAERGATVEITRNGQSVAAVVSIDACRRMRAAAADTLSDVVARFRASVDPRDLDGPDPWGELRDRSPGRDVDLG